MNTKNETPAGELTNAEIREILLAHSYEIKPGFADLKWYVYDGARAVVAADRALRLVATPAGDVAMPVMAWLHDWLCEGKLAQDWISQQESNANTPGSCNIRPLVKQADALAALTAKDAEIARLRKEVAEAWAPQDSTGAAAVDPAYRWRPVGDDTPRGVKLQLIVRGDGVAHHRQYQPGAGWTHWAPLPTFSDQEKL